MNDILLLFLIKNTDVSCSETTANTIAAMLAELAINPDKQEWLYKQIVDAIGNRPPVNEEYKYNDHRLLPQRILITDLRRLR